MVVRVPGWTSPARAAISALTEPRRRSLAHEHQRKSTTGAVASALPASAPTGAPHARGPRPDGRPLRADVAPTRAARHRPDPALTSPRRASPARADVAPAGIRRREHCRPDGRPLRARASPRRAFLGADAATTGAPPRACVRHPPFARGLIPRSCARDHFSIHGQRYHSPSW